jgi:hypothetical protein
VLLNIVDHRDGDEETNAHLSPEEETDFGTADIILDQLLDDMNVIFPRLQGRQCLIDVRPTPFDNKRLTNGSVNCPKSSLTGENVPHNALEYDPDPFHSKHRA